MFVGVNVYIISLRSCCVQSYVMLFSGTCIPVDLASLCMFCSNSIPGCARFY